MVVVVLRKLMSRLNRPIHDIDREKLESFADGAGGHALNEIAPRMRIRAAGEIKTLRIVPRAGAPALEAVISDGRGTVTAIFLGRRKIGGLAAGRKVTVQGMVVADGHRNALFNPEYELL